MTKPVKDAVPLEQLPPYQKRRFLPETVDLTRPEEVVALYERLLGKAVASASDLEQWVYDRSELEAAVNQVRSILYIRMTCQTDDKETADAYSRFIETVVPAIRPIEDKLNRKYLNERERFSLDDKRFEVYDRAVRADVQIFVESNVPLQTQVELLAQEYQTVCGAMTVQFQGKERTLPEMGKFLQDPDRSLRESAWRATAARRLQDKDQLDGLFDRMLLLRHQIAVNAGFKNFRDYQFKAYHRFDYTPEDCKQYHRSVERAVLPLIREMTQKRRRQMKLDALRPWDTSVDPLGRAALKPFADVQEFVTRTQTVFERTDPELGRQFAMMRELGLLDLASRKGKAPGGYQDTLNEARKPFIFMNAVGLDNDVRTLLHEGGHAFHALACAGQPIHDYRHAPMEFSEVASMAMELLAGAHLDVFYSAEDYRRSVLDHFEDVIQILPWVATVDAFQHWIYEHPGHSQNERGNAWLEILDRFSGGLIDWSGLEQERRFLWHRQLHIFEVPFYYIEYGIAQLGALQVWRRARKNQATALKDYRAGLAVGGSRPLPELFRAAGIRFDFSEDMIRPLVEEVRDAWIKLGGD